jgi:hypothetical protein
MTQFSTADGVAKFVSKYLTMDQLNQVTSGNAASSPLLALFGSGNANKPQGLTLSAQMFGSGNTLNLIA